MHCNKKQLQNNNHYDITYVLHKRIKLGGKPMKEKIIRKVKKQVKRNNPNSASSNNNSVTNISRSSN